MKLRFPKLAAAYAEYERAVPGILKLWADAMNDADVKKAQAVEAAAVLKVREAFCEDELNPNSRENSMLLSMNNAAQWARLTL